MNKNIAMLILSVVLLAMILIVLNQWAFSPETAPQNGTDFSDILKKSSAVKVPPDAPGVRIPVSGTPGEEKVNADDARTGDRPNALPDARQDARADAQPAAKDGAMQEAPAAAPVATAEQPHTQTPAKPASAQSAPPVANPTPQAAPTVTAKGSDAKSASTPVAPKPAPAQRSVPVKPLAVNALRSVRFVPAGNGGTLEIQAAGAVSYKVFALRQPQRIVVDLVGTFDKLVEPVVPGNSVVPSVRLGRHEKSVRIVMDIAGTATRDFDAEQPSKDRVRITVR